MGRTQCLKILYNSITTQRALLYVDSPVILICYHICWETPGHLFACRWLWCYYNFLWDGLFNCQDNPSERNSLILLSHLVPDISISLTPLVLLWEWSQFFTQCPLLITISDSQMKVYNKRNWHYSPAIIHSLDKDRNENWQWCKINPFLFQYLRLQ